MKILSEKIFGNYATVFHRTSVDDLVNRVYTEGFNPGDGDMYGKGFYSTYELASQDHPQMSETYGNIVVKFTVQIADFFIFDEEEFMKSPQGREYARLGGGNAEDYLSWQTNRFKMDTSNLNWGKIIALKTGFTSGMALAFIKHIPNFTKKCKGIIFTGSRDGHVLVAYDTKIIMPVSYRMDGSDKFIKVTPNMEYLKKVVANRLSSDSSEVGIDGFVVPNDWGNYSNMEVIITRLSPMRNFVGLERLVSSFPESKQATKINIKVDLEEVSSIKNLIGFPEKWIGDITCRNIKIGSFVGAPRKVDGYVLCENNKLSSFEGFPEEISGAFSCTNNPFKSLKGFPKIIGEDLIIDEGLFTAKEIHAVCDISGDIRFYEEEYEPDYT